MNQIEKSILNLLRLGILDGVEASAVDADLADVLSRAGRHGVLAIAVDGLEKLPRASRPGTSKLMGWFGQVLKQEQQYRRNWAVACQLADLWKSKGIEAVVLKGRSLAQYYPRPEHRYSCDLDVFIGDGWEKACELLRDVGFVWRQRFIRKLREGYTNWEGYKKGKRTSVSIFFIHKIENFGNFKLKILGILYLCIDKS